MNGDCAAGTGSFIDQQAKRLGYEIEEVGDIVAVIDPEKLGLGTTVFVSIETSDHSKEWLARFAEFVRAMPEVVEFYRMAGDVEHPGKSFPREYPVDHFDPEIGLG